MTNPADQELQAIRQTRDFAALRDRVLPMLKPIELLNTVRERKLPMLVYRPFLANLIITYVIEEPSGSLAYINEQHIEQWQISEHELQDIALLNLKVRTDARGSYTVVGSEAQQLVIFNSQDGFDATRLLLTSMLSELSQKFSGQVVIGIPNRDFMIMFSDAERTILDNVAAQIQADSIQRENGLTDQLFTLEQNEVREYIWE